MTTKLNFYTESKFGKFYGKCRELTNISYGPVYTRDAALSGIRRLAKKTAKTATPKATTKQKVNRIVFVVDRSGSMRSLTDAAVTALNQNIQTVREQARKTGQTALVSVLAFDDQVSIVRNNENAETIKQVNRYEVEARGSTALFDAVGDAIDRLRSLPVGKDEDVAYLLIAITDGEENASTRYGSNRNASPLVNLMTQVQATDRWTLTFLVPPGQSYQLVNMGIPAGNVAEWEGSVRGVQQYTGQTVAALGSYFGSRSVGLNSTKAFYQTDLSGLSTKQIKSQLDDISSQVRVLPVDKEQDIRTFVESKLGSYKPGSAFYQLTKDEKTIQGYKDLLVMEKGKKAVFGGSDARDVLGMPTGDLKVRPGNHANFDIFVQSTSLNRKLVRGTKLIVKT